MRIFGFLVVTDSSGLLLLSPFRGLAEGYRPYFENYTVDASILETIFGSFHMVIERSSFFNFEFEHFGVRSDSDLM